MKSNSNIFPAIKDISPIWSQTAYSANPLPKLPTNVPTNTMHFKTNMAIKSANRTSSRKKKKILTIRMSSKNHTSCSNSSSIKPIIKKMSWKISSKLRCSYKNSWNRKSKTKTIKSQSIMSLLSIGSLSSDTKVSDQSTKSL